MLIRYILLSSLSNGVSYIEFKRIRRIMTKLVPALKWSKYSLLFIFIIAFIGIETEFIWWVRVGELNLKFLFSTPRALGEGIQGILYYFFNFIIGDGI